MTRIATETLEPLWDKVLHSADEDGNIVLTKDDVPVAQLHLYANNGKNLRPRGLAEGDFVLTDKFFDPLPEDLLRLFNGEEE